MSPEQAEAQKMGGISVRTVLADIAYTRGDWANYDHLIDSFRGTPTKASPLSSRPLARTNRAKARAGRLTWQQARAGLLSAGVKDFAAGVVRS